MSAAGHYDFTRQSVNWYRRIRDNERRISLRSRQAPISPCLNNECVLAFVADTEFVYKDSHGGVTLYNAENLTTRILMTNSTFVSNQTRWQIGWPLKSLVKINSNIILVLLVLAVLKRYVDFMIFLCFFDLKCC